MVAAPADATPRAEPRNVTAVAGRAGGAIGSGERRRDKACVGFIVPGVLKEILSSCQSSGRNIQWSGS